MGEFTVSTAQGFDLRWLFINGIPNSTILGPEFMGDERLYAVLAGETWAGGPQSVVGSTYVTFRAFSFGVPFSNLAFFTPDGQHAAGAVWQAYLDTGDSTYMRPDWGLRGNDNVTGAAGPDRLFGFAGRDILRGQGGDDTLDGGTGDNSLDGGEGADTADYTWSSSDLSANLGAASVSGWGGTDVLIAIERLLSGAGNDSLRAGATTTLLHGGAGADTLFSALPASTTGTLDGGEGIDTMDYATAGPTGISANLASGKATGWGGQETLLGLENLAGGAGNDTLTGSTGGNTLWGRDGDDTLFGLAGNDLIMGGAGRDSLDGGDDGDTLGGGDAADVLEGGHGRDLLFGEAGDDTLSGGGGDDLLFGGAGANRLNGGTGTNLYQIASATDQITVTAGATDLAFVLTAGWTAPAGLAAAYLLGEARLLSGSEAADVLVANPAGGSTVAGGGGDDTLWGSTLPDDLRGDAGRDVLRGFAGADRLAGGPGDDQLVGGPGADRFVFDVAGWGYDQIFDYSAAEGDVLDFRGSGLAGAGVLDILSDGANVALVRADGSRIDLYGVARPEDIIIVA